MTRDEHRAKCIEAMKAAGRSAIDCSDFINLIERMFDALRGIARVVPIEATDEMITSGLGELDYDGPRSNLLRQWRAMSAAGSLINAPEEKP